MANAKGKITQVIGAVVDVQFPNQQSLPEIYNALTIVRPGGEKLILSNNSGQIIDYLNFPTQSTNVGYARIPNGIGNFVYNTPSFGYDNDFANVSSINQSKLSCYPNPFKNHLNILLENPNVTLISICDIQGKIILQQKVKFL